MRGDKRWDFNKLKLLICLIIMCSVISFFLYFSTEKISDSNVVYAPVYLLIVIVSKPENFNERTALRETWTKLIKPSHSAKYFFIIGDLSLNDVLTKRLQKEKSEHEDIVFIPILDNYRDLTKKVLTTFKYMYKKINFQYLLKCDDDTFVNFEPFYNELKVLQHPKLYWGYFNGQAHVFSKGPWKELDWYLCDKYLPYALGGGYVLAKDLVEFITNNADLLRILKSEDVSVGAWLAGVLTKRVHDIRFDTQIKSRGCHSNFLLRHKQSEYDIKLSFDSLIRDGTICDREYDTSLRPYSYNWSALPSSCCRYVDPSTSHIPQVYISN